MPESKRQHERLIVMPLLGIIAINYPLLSLFSRVKLFLGVPILYLYLFLVWFIFIALIAAIMEKPASTQGLSRPPKSEKNG